MFYRKNSGGVLENVTVNSQSFADTMYRQIAQVAFDAAHPVDELYFQYPGQKNPNELFNSDLVSCTWEDISSSYAGRFPRIAGGAAATFSETSTSGSNQGQATAKNGLSASASSSFSGTRRTGTFGTVQTTSGIGASFSGPFSKYTVAQTWGYGTGNEYSNVNWDYTPAGSVSTSVSLGNGDEETRPINFTYRVWIRRS